MVFVSVGVLVPTNVSVAKYCCHHFFDCYIAIFIWKSLFRVQRCDDCLITLLLKDMFKSAVSVPRDRAFFIEHGVI